VRGASPRDAFFNAQLRCRLEWTAFARHRPSAIAQAAHSSVQIGDAQTEVTKRLALLSSSRTTEPHALTGYLAIARCDGIPGHGRPHRSHALKPLEILLAALLLERRWTLWGRRPPAL